MQNIQNFPRNIAKEKLLFPLDESLLRGTFVFMKPYENLSPEDMDGEIWKIIPELPLYEASNYGRIRFYPNQRIRKQQKRFEYLGITIECGEINGGFYIHKLVALAFNENPNNYPMINHLDGDKYNNRPENLQWCNAKMNVNHARETGLMIPCKGEPIIQMDMKGNHIKTWNGIKEAQRFIGVQIGGALTGRYSHAGGFTWRYVDEEKNTKKFVPKMKFESRKPVIQLTKEGEYIKKWDSMVEAEKKLGIGGGTILKTFKKAGRKSAGGYRWLYLTDYQKLKESNTFDNV